MEEEIDVEEALEIQEEAQECESKHLAQETQKGNAEDDEGREEVQSRGVTPPTLERCEEEPVNPSLAAVAASIEVVEATSEVR